MPSHTDPYADQPWTDCSAPCGGGTRTRFDVNGSNPQEIPCHTQSCRPGESCSYVVTKIHIILVWHITPYSGQGSHWLIDSPTIIYIHVIGPSEPFVNVVFKHTIDEIGWRKEVPIVELTFHKLRKSLTCCRVLQSTNAVYAKTECCLYKE